MDIPHGQRGAPNALVMGDLPFGSYQSAGTTAIDNACEMIKQSQCDAIKIEGDRYPPQLQAMIGR